MGQEVKARDIVRCLTQSGEVPFDIWIRSLPDKKARALIYVRLERLRKGLFGDTKGLGGGLQELRVDYGPGYRIYFGADRQSEVIVLLFGGDKKSQAKDILLARRLWDEYQKE